MGRNNSRSITACNNLGLRLPTAAIAADSETPPLSINPLGPPGTPEDEENDWSDGEFITEDHPTHSGADSDGDSEDGNFDEAEIRNEADLLLFSERLVSGYSDWARGEAVRKACSKRPARYTGNAASTKRGHLAAGRKDGTPSVKGWFPLKRKSSATEMTLPADALIKRVRVGVGPVQGTHSAVTQADHGISQMDVIMIDSDSDYRSDTDPGPSPVLWDSASDSDEGPAETLRKFLKHQPPVVLLGLCEDDDHLPEGPDLGISNTPVSCEACLTSGGCDLQQPFDAVIHRGVIGTSAPMPGVPGQDATSLTLPDMRRTFDVGNLAGAVLETVQASVRPATVKADIAPWKDLPGLSSVRQTLRKLSKDRKIDLFFRSRLLAMVAVLNFYLDEESDLTFREASMLASKALGHGNYHARNLRRWLLDFKAYAILPEHAYGRFNTSAMADEDLAVAIQEHLAGLASDGKWIRAEDVVDFMATDKMRGFLGKKVKISLTTARRWLTKMEWRYGKSTKGAYFDGHEREDVLVYRKVFLERWSTVYEPRMFLYDRDGLKTQDPATDLRNGKRRIILYTHDESTFYANDRRKQKWAHKDQDHPPQPKGDGESLMISDFLSPEYGRLTHDRVDARVVFKAGKNRDGWFTNDDLVVQVETAIDIFEDRHGHHNTALFVFDNATTHQKRAGDALSATKMVLNPHATWTAVKGGPRMRAGVLADGQAQDLYFPADHPEHPNHFKGMRVILQERGLWHGKLKAQCPDFKCTPGATNCCARRILFNQPDFVGQKSHLEEIITGRGHLCDFYPKYHCELNFIEQYWGEAKRLYRMTRPTKGIDAMEANVLSCLDGVPLEQIRRYSIRACRFMDAYRKGLNSKQAAWATRKYRGHRVLPASIMHELDI